MTRITAVSCLSFCAAISTPLFSGTDLSSYRGFEFGMPLSAAAKRAGIQLSEARIVHQRPSLIQELDWQPGAYSGSATKNEAIKSGVLSFYEGELSRIVVTYDRYSVEGMTAEDLIEAISKTYGIATRPAAEVQYQSNYGKVAKVIARWEDTAHSYNLVRSGEGSSFALVLFSKRTDSLAEHAIAEAARLDAEEAPQREIEKQKKRDEEERLVSEKARSVNKPKFRP